MMGISWRSLEVMGMEWPWVARIRYLEGLCKKASSRASFAVIVVVLVLVEEVVGVVASE